MAWLNVKLAGGRERAHEILDDVTFLGSSEECEIRVSDPQAAARHCQVLRSGASLKLIDLGSPVGTLVNRQRVKEKVLLDGDVIQIGAAQIAFKAGGSGAGAALAKTAVMAAPPAAPVARPAATAPRAARPAAAPPAAAAAPAPAAARRPSRYAARAGRRGREEAADEDSGSRAERRFSRSSSSSSIWMKVGITAVSLTALVFLMTKALKKDPEYDRLYQEAQTLAGAGNNDLALAKAKEALGRAQEGTLQYIRAKDLVDEISSSMKAGVAQKDLKGAYEYFESNLKPFYDTYIDDKSKKFAGKDYLNDPVTARYFVEYRLDYFMKRFPEAEQTGTVKAWAESLKRRYNPADPFPRPDVWWDTEVIATFESKLEHYGTAWKLRSQFKARNPDAKNLKNVEEEIRLERQRGEVLARAYVEEIERALRAKSYGTAMGKAIKACRNLDGLSDLVAQVKGAGQRVADAARAAGFPFDAATLRDLERAGTGVEIGG